LCSEDGTFPVVAGYCQFFQYNREIKMRSFIVAVCCAALVGSISVASAQTTGPAGQEATKANDPMNTNAKTMKKKHKTKKSMTKSDDGMAKDGMKKDTK
jgi:pentapeptide MXKDX repeat protein